MHRNTPALRSVLLGVAAAATFVATTSSQSILGPPSEANHYIETPKGWVHPKTPWGEPDIQATLNMMRRPACRSSGAPTATASAARRAT